MNQLLANHQIVYTLSRNKTHLVLRNNSIHTPFNMFTIILVINFIVTLHTLIGRKLLMEVGCVSLGRLRWVARRLHLQGFPSLQRYCRRKSIMLVMLYAMSTWKKLFDNHLDSVLCRNLYSQNPPSFFYGKLLLQLPACFIPHSWEQPFDETPPKWD